MALSFTKNVSNHADFGVNVLSPLLNGASQISMAAWVRQRTMTTGGTDNGILRAVIDAATDGIFFGLVGAQDLAKVRIAARSTGANSPQATSGATTITQNAWLHAGAVADIANNQVRAYLNGVLDGSTATSFIGSTYVVGTPTSGDTIGGYDTAAPTTGKQTNGDIAEVAIWKGDIGDLGFASLADGYSPLMIRPNLLIEYWDLMNAIRGGRRGIIGTITGSIPQAADHPRIIRP